MSNSPNGATIQKEEWIAKVVEILTTKSGADEGNKNIAEWAKAMFESYCENDSEWWPWSPEDAVDEEISCL